MAGLRVAVAVLLLGIPTLARAQAGWYLTPFVSLGGEYQSNIFGTSEDEESDFVMRFTPGLAFGYFSEPITVALRYSLDGEVFADHSELDNFGNNQRAVLTARYLPGGRWTLGLTGSFTQTETSGDLLVPRAVSPEPVGGPPPPPAPAPTLPPGTVPPATAPSPPSPAGAAPPGDGVAPPVVPGVDTGRSRSRYVFMSPWALYQLNMRTRLDGAYSFTWADVEGGAEDRMHQFTTGVSYDLTPADRVSLRDRLNVFDQEVGGTTWSNAVLAGWRRQLTERTTLFLEAGPRVNDDGHWSADATARLDHQLQSATVYLAYVRAEQLVVGRTGPSTTDTGSIGAFYQPLRNLLLGAAGTISRVSSAQDSGVGDTTLYGFDLSAAYQFTQWLSARAYYRASFEDGDSDIEHHYAGVALDVAYTLRVR
jgi:hypothetical protein